MFLESLIQFHLKHKSYFITHLDMDGFDIEEIKTDFGKYNSLRIRDSNK
jgi:hypothetical protein